MRQEERESKEDEDDEEEGDTSSTSTTTTTPQNPKQQNIIHEISEKLINGDLRTKIQAALDLRKVVRKSSSSSSSSSLNNNSFNTRSKFAAAGVIQPLVFMLLSTNNNINNNNIDAREASLLALLNLAVRNERNKVKIVTAGAIPPLIELLKSQDSNLRELAAAAILTLSASTPNKPIIVESGAAPLLVEILSCGTLQGKADAVTALHNLSTCIDKSNPIIDARAVYPLINLLKECKKYSKFAEKASSLLEILSKSEEGRTAITNSHKGILTLVETVEDGNLISTEHAAGALLNLCQSCRDKYRELILNEGAIPGLLQLTVEGTSEAQEKARTLLDLLREKPPGDQMASLVLEKIVYDIAKRVDGADKAKETAKRLLQDMVQRSMELSMSSIQHRASTSEFPK
ncbi:hypothetical protein ACFE04_001889 [Oxalis oulophora]